MNLFAHSIASKGGVAFVRRVGTIAWRFQLTSARAERSVGAYLATLRHHGCNATFPITAVVLRRHQDLIRHLADEGVEFAVHGYVHTDMTTLTATQQCEHLARALDVFDLAGIPPRGFRGPYLRYDEDTIAAAASLGFEYVSNETVSYDVLEPDSFNPARWAEYQRALKLYSAIPVDQAIVRPRRRSGVIEIPVAMPDDEILVDRLGLRHGEQIGAIWVKALDRSYARGDLLTLQLHPERGGLCRKGLSILLTVARSKAPAVWIAQLRDIADWWRRRAAFRLEVEAAGDGRWRISGTGAPDVVILLQNLRCPGAMSWYGPYARLDRLGETVESPVRPTIGVSAESEELRRFLEEEGYAVSSGVEPESCALYLDRPGPLTLANQAAVLERIENSPAPLVRLARWPDGARSALSITGDVDALTLRDFVSRTWEVI